MCLEGNTDESERYMREYALSKLTSWDQEHITMKEETALIARYRDEAMTVYLQDKMFRNLMVLGLLQEPNHDASLSATESQEISA